MEDRDGKKPFIIPKTHTFNKDALISEKPDSRNVTELFDELKSCALEAQFDFRQNECKTCDTIRNLKLQKLYNDKRIKMKKDQDPVERLAFHLITYRDVALNVANDGLRCEHLSFPIEKYLGNPKDGVHLSRRPDVVLTSSGAQGLYRFGLLVCKVLLGKGYATIPSTTNNQLPGQLHYDHHFCKIQPINKEQRHIDDLLANSLIFCYEHENFETVSHPPQILPIAILWYDLTEKFAPELISSTIVKNVPHQESQHQNGKLTKGKISLKKKPSTLATKTIPSLLNKPIIFNSGTWEGPTQDTPPSEPTQNSNSTESLTSSTTKYPKHVMVPYQRLYSNPLLLPSSYPEQQQQTNPTQQITSSRDPRLLRPKREIALISSETIPLSPQHLLHERSLSEGSSSIRPSKTSSDGSLSITKSSSSIGIPLVSSISLIDPRLQTVQQSRNIFYLELQAVKHALQQQKRLNHYYDSKSGLPPKTSYTLVPYLMRQVSNDEYERLLNDENNTYKFNKHSNGYDYPLLSVSVVDCYNFGLLKPTTDNQLYVDLEQNENKLAFEQIEISNELIQREKQLNSQQIRLRIREKRQRRIQQQINEKQNSKSSSTSPLSSTLLSNSKLYITNGRQLLKEHKASTTSPNTHMSSDLLDFFSREYKNENRPHVKHLLAELIGVFVEKYHVKYNQTVANSGQNGEGNHSSVEESIVDDQTINSVIDMDIDSPSSQGLCDYDERFRVPTPPPPLPPPITLPPLPPSLETIYIQSISSPIRTQTLSNEPNQILDDPNYKDRCHKLVEQLKEQYRQNETTSSSSISGTKSELMIPTQEAAFKACLGQFESSSSENSLTDDNQPLTINDDLQQKENTILSSVQDLVADIQDDSKRSREEFVKLLTKEAYISKPTSPVKGPNNRKRLYDYKNNRRRPYNDNDNQKKNSSTNRSNSHRRYSRPSNNKNGHVKTTHEKLSSTRTVKLISDRSTLSNENQDSKQNTELSTNNQNDLQDKSAVKRINLDSPSSPLNTTNEVEQTTETNLKDLGLKSIVTVPTNTNDHDCRRDLNEKRRPVPTTDSVVSTTDHSKTKSSRSRSRSKSKDGHQKRRRSSTYSRSSSIKNSKVASKSQHYSPPSRSSSITSRTSLNDNRHRHEQKQNKDEHRHERRRSSDLSNRHRKQYSNQSSDRHQILNETSYRNSLPYHQRNMNDLIPSSNVHHPQQRQTVRHKRFNYNHQSVADHPRFSNPNILPSPTPLMDFNYPKSPTHHRSASPGTIRDRNVNSSYYQSESSTINYQNCYDLKPSNAIERLQMFLQNKTSEPFDRSQVDYSVDKTVKYSPSSTNNDTSHWSTSSHTSKTKPDTIVQNNNQTFTYNDNEKLLTMVQRLRN